MKIKIACIVCITLLLTSCQNKSNIEFKYSDREDLFECSNVDMDLMKESVYAFENFIETNYNFKNRDQLIFSYDNFLKNSGDNLLPIAELFDDHLKSIVAELKKQEDLWYDKGEEFSLNYSHPIVQCIIDNLEESQFKSVFVALSQSNTLKTTLIAPSLRENKEKIEKDRAMTTYIALDLFYAKVLNLDFSLSQEELSKKISEINRQHIGHQH